jgi:hypothetical protein
MREREDEKRGRMALTDTGRESKDQGAKPQEGFNRPE